MTSTATEIKNIITSHLRRGLFGMEIYGQHEHTIFDGKQDRALILQAVGANRFMRHGVVTVWHPTFGKWQATLLSDHHCGKPVQVFTAEQIRADAARVPSYDFIYKVYGGTAPTAEESIAMNQAMIANALFGDTNT